MAAHRWSDLGICYNAHCAACTGGPGDQDPCPYPRSVLDEESVLREAEWAAENPISVDLLGGTADVVGVFHLQVALKAYKEAVAERNHLKLVSIISQRPSLAGPAMLNDELPENPTDAMRIRGAHLTTAIWTLAVLAKANPAAVNHLAVTLTFNSIPEDAPEEIQELRDHSLEVALVKPGKKGPSKMRAEAMETIEALQNTIQELGKLVPTPSGTPLAETTWEESPPETRNHLVWVVYSGKTCFYGGAGRGVSTPEEAKQYATKQAALADSSWGSQDSAQVIPVEVPLIPGRIICEPCANTGVAPKGSGSRALGGGPDFLCPICAGSGFIYPR